MWKQSIPITMALGIATAALAHDGVKNPTVKARMMLMGEVKDATGIIVAMAKGEAPFDATQAQAARTALVKAARQVPGAFGAPETDPKSEALPVIWEDWKGFVDQADRFSAAATAMDVTSLDTLRAGVGPLGKSCGSCHETYRVKR